MGENGVTSVKKNVYKYSKTCENHLVYGIWYKQSH